MIKDYLKNLPKPIANLLPSGAINQLAEKHKYTRQTITRMLKGETGSEENVKSVLISCAKILSEYSREYSRLSNEIYTECNDIKDAAAGRPDKYNKS